VTRTRIASAAIGVVSAAVLSVAVWAGAAHAQTSQSFYHAAQTSSSQQSFYHA